MQGFQKYGLSKSELCILNNWRLLYQVNFLSELCTTDGTQIRPSYTTYPTDKPHNGWQSKIRWPNQNKPDAKSFQLWKRSLKNCFLNPSNNKPPLLGKCIVQNVQRILPPPDQTRIYKKRPTRLPPIQHGKQKPSSSHSEQRSKTHYENLDTDR
jgi:hypothetical protein